MLRGQPIESLPEGSLCVFAVNSCLIELLWSSASFFDSMRHTPGRISCSPIPVSMPDLIKTILRITCVKIRRTPEYSINI